jgi:hypothetical protein
MDEKESEEYYHGDTFTGWTEQDSYIPTKRLKVLPLIKKNFQHLYYITQSGAPFGWHTFTWEVINSISMATILCLVGYNVYSGTVTLHPDGHTSDFWMASFGIYAALVFGTTAVVLVRSSQIGWTYILLFVVLLSIVPFYLLSYLFDTILITTPNFKEYVQVELSSTYDYYLYFLFFAALSLLVETTALFVRYYYRPTVADYFNWLIKKGKANSAEYFDPAIVQNFKQLRDPIPKKIDIEWSDILSKSHVEDGDLNAVEQEANKDETQKAADYKSLNSAEFTTVVQSLGSTPINAGDLSKRSLFSQEASPGNDDQPEARQKAEVYPSEVSRLEHPVFAQPRRISNREVELPLQPTVGEGDLGL